MSSISEGVSGLLGYMVRALEAAARTIECCELSWKEEKAGLEARIRELELQVEGKNYHIEALKNEGAHLKGGDIAAGLFKRVGTTYVQMPKQMRGTEGVITLYYEAGWPRN